jgi:hypothetical protein
MYKIALTIICLCWIGSELKHNAIEIDMYIKQRKCDSVNEYHKKINCINKAINKYNTAQTYEDW